MPIGMTEFAYLQKLVQDASSIVIEPGKEYLAEARLSTIAHAEGMRSVQELIGSLRISPDSGLQSRVLDAMTNNETTFFRDQHPFTVLRNTILPGLLDRHATDRRLTIWSAASSSGQEAYSIAMMLEDDFQGLPQWQVRIIGTDISGAVLERARKGRYSQMEMSRGLLPQQIQRHFTRHGNEWQISETIRRRVEFRRLNLFDSWTGLPDFDIIFLRNVLIYFEVEKKREILRKIRGILRPNGALLLGGAETTFGLDDIFVRVTSGPATYYSAG
jgi:chemotaxis protein methyltransferase CheR